MTDSQTIFKNEAELETYIRNIITDKIIPHNKDLVLLDNKKAVDILICRNGEQPALFFLEVKYHKKNHGRLGFGSRNGIGFQPEILTKQPEYFESNLKWIIANESHNDIGIIFTNSQTIRQYISGGEIGQKFNNIQNKIFKDLQGFNEKDLIEKLMLWLKS